MGFKRRVFLIGSATIAGGGLFALHWRHDAAIDAAEAATSKGGVGSFSGWLKIGTDDAITLHVPTTDMGQGSHTALAQMLAEELDADFAKISVMQAPAEYAFADSFVIESGAGTVVTIPDFLAGTAKAFYSMTARQMDFQQSSGSNAISGTGQFGIRVIGAAARMALLETAAVQLEVPLSELTVAKGIVSHAKSGRSLRFGALSTEAAERSLSDTPTLKDRKAFGIMGTSVPRFDVPAKVNGTAIYGSDFQLPDMRIAVVKAAPVHGGKLLSVDPAPALAVKGVEKVIKLENAVIVIGKGYWQANQGLQSLSPKFSDGGNGNISTASIFAAQDKLRLAEETSKEEDGDVKAALAASGVKTIDALYQVPFLHHAMMEPFAITAHFKNGKLDIWGGVQAPLEFKAKAMEISGLDGENVIFHPMIMGGGFGRRFRSTSQHIVQIVKIAMQVPYPVKLLWSREEDVIQGAFRPQVSARMKGGIDAKGKIAALSIDYAQNLESWAFPGLLVYDIPATQKRFFEYTSHSPFAAWRSVDHSQHGFYVESFIDELASLAGADPLQFRLDHLSKQPRHHRVLQEVATQSQWNSPLPKGAGRGVAIISMGPTIVALVIEASISAEGMPRILRAVSVVDAGFIVNPDNARAQIEGGILMGLSSGLLEQITFEKGAVTQSNFGDYPILQMGQTPKMETHFLNSDADIGGVGEMGVPPAAPALANALFAITGKRIRALPIVGRKA